MAATAVSRYGIAITPPSGWEAVIFQRLAGLGETTHPVLHAANFALPAERGDYGSGAVEAMLLGDVFFSLLEFHPASARQALFASHTRPTQLSAGDLDPRSLQRTLPGQAGVQRFFSANGRAFCLYVVVAGPVTRPGLLTGPNRLLQSLQIASGG